jgi:peptidoglycan/xylan/chitin deacetylase (PgdA/CDA1 family)
MGFLRRTAVLASRVLLCVSAVASGAAVAAATTPEPRRIAITEGIAPERAPDVEPRRERAPAPEPTPIATTEPATTDAPFARSLRDGLVMTGATRHRLILFTFDDGPDHRYTRDLLDALDHERVRAVFFLAARRFEGNVPRDRELADIAREIAARGHFVGNHTMDHLQLPTVFDVDLPSQIDAADVVFERVLGERTTLLRPPGGARSARVDGYLAAHGYTQMLWNLGTGDFQVRTPEAVVSTFSAVLAREENERGVRGGIVLLHDIHEWSVRAFPRIVALLEDRNCELLARGEELYDFVDDPGLFFVPRGDESPSAEAPFVELSSDVLEARQARARARAETHCSSLQGR